MSIHIMISGRDSKIHVFRLSDFDGDFNTESSAMGRQDLKEHRLERTRGCHMYAISRPGGSHLRMVSGSTFHAVQLFLESHNHINEKTLKRQCVCVCMPVYLFQTAIL